METSPIIIEVIDSMPEPKKLRLLADWLDLQHKKGVFASTNNEVQDDLRSWATMIENFNTNVVSKGDDDGDEVKDSDPVEAAEA